MKTSNIILLSIFLSIIIGITALFFVGMYEVNNYKGNNADSNQSYVAKIEKKSVDAFNTLIVSGNGVLKLGQDANENYIESNSKNIINSQGDTLKIIIDTKCKLKFTKFKNIILEGNVFAKAEDIANDSLKISASENSRLQVQNISASSLAINMFGNANVNISYIKSESGNTHALFYISENAKLKIKDANNLQMQVNKSGNAQFKIY